MAVLLRTATTRILQYSRQAIAENRREMANSLSRLFDYFLNYLTFISQIGVHIEQSVKISYRYCKLN